jgi:hypothetical protein
MSIESDPYFWIWLVIGLAILMYNIRCWRRAPSWWRATGILATMLAIGAHIMSYLRIGKAKAIRKETGD